MHAITCQCIQEHRQGSHEGFTFTRCHLGDFTLVQCNTAKELYVIMHHIPLDLVATCRPFIMIDSFVTINSNEVISRIGSELTVEIISRHHGLGILRESASSVLNDTECYRHDFVKCILQHIKHLFILLVYLIENGLTLIDRSFLYLRLQLSDFLFVWLSSSLHIVTDFFGLGTKLIIA